MLFDFSVLVQWLCGEKEAELNLWAHHKKTNAFEWVCILWLSLLLVTDPHAVVLCYCNHQVMNWACLSQKWFNYKIFHPFRFFDNPSVIISINIALQDYLMWESHAGTTYTGSIQLITTIGTGISIISSCSHKSSWIQFYNNFYS